MIREGKRRTKMSVVGDEKRVGYRCSDETGSEDEVVVEEMEWEWCKDERRAKKARKEVTLPKCILPRSFPLHLSFLPPFLQLLLHHGSSEPSHPPPPKCTFCLRKTIRDMDVRHPSLSL